MIELHNFRVNYNTVAPNGETTPEVRTVEVQGEFSGGFTEENVLAGVRDVLSATHKRSEIQIQTVVYRPRHVADERRFTYPATEEPGTGSGPIDGEKNGGAVVEKTKEPEVDPTDGPPKPSEEDIIGADLPRLKDLRNFYAGSTNPERREYFEKVSVEGPDAEVRDRLRDSLSQYFYPPNS